MLILWSVKCYTINLNDKFEITLCLNTLCTNITKSKFAHFKNIFQKCYIARSTYSLL